MHLPPCLVHGSTVRHAVKPSVRKDPGALFFCARGRKAPSVAAGIGGGGVLARQRRTSAQSTSPTFPIRCSSLTSRFEAVCAALQRLRPVGLLSRSEPGMPRNSSHQSFLIRNRTCASLF